MSHTCTATTIDLLVVRLHSSLGSLVHAFLVHTKCCPALSRSHSASSEQDHRILALPAHTTNVHSGQLMPHGLYQPSAMHAFGVPAQLYQALTWPLLMCDQIHILHLALLTPHIWLEQCLSECLGGL